MKIDGREIADEIFQDLKKRVGELEKKGLPAGRQGVIPHLAVILVGEDPASKVYVMQKKARGEDIDVTVDLFHYPKNVSISDLLDKVRELNSNPQIHGIIVQRPLPEHINQDVLEKEIIDAKDVDGFKPESPFIVPIVLAVLLILEEVFYSSSEMQSIESRSSRLANARSNNNEFLNWLKSKNIVLLGKGSTAGKPIFDYFTEIGAQPTLIDSKTENPESITKQADIIISSVGKKDLIKPEVIKKEVILISIGINRGADGKLHGDYDEEKIQEMASFYTPTPGGVGPVNVAMLLANLVTSAEKQNSL